MARDDVPVMVSREPGAIVVHGPMRQQMIFDAFVAIIDGTENDVRPYQLPGGKLDALTELMIRPDVPILVSPGDEAISRHGNELEQMIFGAFVEMIHPREGRGRRAAIDTPEFLIHESTADAADGRLHELHEHLAIIEQQVHEIAHLQEMKAHVHQQMSAHEAQYDELLEAAERMHEESEDFEREADRLAEEADRLGGDAKRSAMRRAREILRRARTLHRESETVERQAEMIERQHDALEHQADAIEEAIEAIEDALEELRSLADFDEDDRDEHDHDEDDDRHARE